MSSAALALACALFAVASALPVVAWGHGPGRPDLWSQPGASGLCLKAPPVGQPYFTVAEWVPCPALATWPSHDGCNTCSGDPRGLHTCTTLACARLVAQPACDLAELLAASREYDQAITRFRYNTIVLDVPFELAWAPFATAEERWRDAIRACR